MEYRGPTILFHVYMLSILTIAETKNVLVTPYCNCINSHLINLEVLSWYLSTNNFSVTFLVPDTYRGPYASADDRLSTDFKILTFKDSPSNESLELPVCDGFDSLDSFYAMDVNAMRMVEHSTSYKGTAALFSDSATLEYLKHGGFQVVITDYFWLLGHTVAAYLQIPLITVQMLPGAHVMQIPDLYTGVSYIPDNYLALSDEMSIWERTINAWNLFVLRPLQRKYVDWIFYPKFRRIMAEHEFKDPDPHLVFSNISFGMMNSDFLLDYPGPIYSDMLFIGGFFNQWARTQKGQVYKRVNRILESAEDVIVVSFGSMLLDYGEQWGELLAGAFARLPCKIIWRYPQLSKPPRNLGPNTVLLDWLPQPYLLSHPKTRLFVTHCGAGGTYESLYHGVPILGVPLAGDQAANCRKLSDRLRVGKCFELSTLSSESVYTAIQEILYSSTFRSNAERTSRTFKDRVATHGPNILRTVSSIVDHGGALHLHPKSRYMEWHKKYLIDVCVLVSAGVVVSFFAPYFLFSRFFLRSKTEKLD